MSNFQVEMLPGACLLVRGCNIDQDGHVTKLLEHLAVSPRKMHFSVRITFAHRGWANTCRCNLSDVLDRTEKDVFIHTDKFFCDNKVCIFFRNTKYSD
jgi:hypothetical protein